MLIFEAATITGDVDEAASTKLINKTRPRGAQSMNFWIKHVLIAHGNRVTIEYIQKRGSACVEAFREVTHLVFGDSDRARRSKEVGCQTDIEALVNQLLNKKKDAAGNSVIPKKAAEKKSAMGDVQELGAGVWQAGKFTEFLAQTTYDLAWKSSTKRIKIRSEGT
ncbi:hypothetical protein BDZ89DRAFT_1135407 [Hymenopellis radicata]|nr:hypothetical protein BDZ89DRAFT_1135407 [Hymenopellis radicata]